ATTPLHRDNTNSTHLAFFVDTDNGASISRTRDVHTHKRSLASGGSPGDVHTDDDSQTVPFSSDVHILSAKSPVLNVALVIVNNANGAEISKAVNASVHDGGSDYGAGHTISDSQIVVNDISNPGAGDVVIHSKDAISGTGGTWEFFDSLPQVNIRNESDK